MNKNLGLNYYVIVNKIDINFYTLYIYYTIYTLTERLISNKLGISIFQSISLEPMPTILVKKISIGTL